jgi:hypothetical protein
MNLTKFLSLAFLSAFILGGINAYGRTGIKEDKFKAKKVAFFTQKLNLNSDEAEVFWPVYNEYQEKKDDLFSQRKAIFDEYSRGINKMSNKEVAESLAKLTQISKDEAALLETYIAKFKEILPDKKVAQLFVVEEDYKKFLLQQIRNSAINR